ncbi:MAG: polyphosphate polymerase domain-containing protein [Planctomycetales bacterium]|nr:polyphosphate polymerase domain-containing protein [Planctomycetales bacterium]
MREDKLQSSRYEFKYVVTEEKAHQIREFVQMHLDPDDFTAGKEGRGYDVHSLYLDGRSFPTCVAVIHGEKNRYKLRLRFYDETGPVFFEIKRRVNLVILKQRACVQREFALQLLDGARPDPRFLTQPNSGKHLKALYNFCELRDAIEARPAAYTSYLREGYERHGDNAVRVTFDRELKAGKFNGQLSVADLHLWDRPEMGGVVLELKFTDRFPKWMLTLVEAFNLTRTGFAKYCKCVSLVHDLGYDA